MKGGVRFYYWDLFNNAVNSSYQANTYVARSGYAEYYKAYPMDAAFYLQDKLEYEGMVANIGIRAEAFNFQANVPVNKFNVFYPGKDGPSEEAGNPFTTPSQTKFIFMPRIGVSFPIGEATAFRIQYGHFASMPLFTQALSQRTDRGWLVLGNAGLDFKKTINYEFGLQQMIGETNRLDLAIYYNDRVTQVGIQRIASLTGSLARETAGYTDLNEPLYPYTTYANNAFGSTVGMEITFEKINLDEWGYRLSYSLSQTTDGNFGPEFIYPNNTRNEQRNFTGEFLGAYDRTHNFRGLLQYRFKEDGGFEIFNLKPLSSTIFSLTYSAQSGLPYTYITTFSLKDVVNNRRYPLESSFNFNAVKNFELSGYRFILGLRVMNVFNNKWITPMDQTDLIDWVERGITMADLGNDPTRKSHLIAPFKTYRNIPRQFFITVGVGF